MALSSHQAYFNFRPFTNKSDRLVEHIREAFRLGRFSCIPTPHRLSMMACLHLSSELKYAVRETMLLNFLKLIITLNFS